VIDALPPMFIAPAVRVNASVTVTLPLPLGDRTRSSARLAHVHRRFVDRGGTLGVIGRNAYRECRLSVKNLD